MAENEVNVLYRKCPVCGEKMVMTTKSCPKCGLDMKKLDRERFIILIILIVFAIVCVIIKELG